MADDPQLEPDPSAPSLPTDPVADPPAADPEPAAALEPDPPAAADAPGAPAPVKVEGRNRRSDDDALEGGWADVVSGDFAGRHGVFDYVVTYSPDDGYPATVALLTRDEMNEHLIVSYSDLRPSTAGKR
jgi:hypothetical protein